MEEYKYVADLPYLERRHLCTILDQSNKYEELGIVHMQFDSVTLHDVRREIERGRSPSNELLNLWSYQNHTILELFVLLCRMKHYQAMTVLKPFVDESYHQLIVETDPDMVQMMAMMELNQQQQQQRQIPQQCRNVPQQNQLGSEKILNIPQLPIIAVEDTWETNERAVDNQQQRHLLKPKSPLPVRSPS